MAIASAALPIQKFVMIPKESVHLAAMGNRKMYIVDQVPEPGEYNLSAQIGMIEAWHCSACGKMCSGNTNPPSFIEDIFRDYDFEHYTSNTITTYQNLEKS